MPSAIPAVAFAARQVNPFGIDGKEPSRPWVDGVDSLQRVGNCAPCATGFQQLDDLKA